MTTFKTEMTIWSLLGNWYTLSDFAQSFKAGMDSRFKKWGFHNDRFGRVGGALAEVHQITSHFVYRQLFESFGRPLEDICLDVMQFAGASFTRGSAAPSWPSSTYCLIQRNGEFFVLRYRLDEHCEKQCFIYQLDDPSLWTCFKSEVIIRK